MISAREEDAAREGKPLQRVPVEAVVLSEKDFECTELVTALRDWQRKTRRSWSDCAVLYRTHSHRDQLATELASQGIPFSIENMDVLDMPEARDLFACLGAVVSDADGASLFRVAALPQFVIDPEKLRAGIKALPRDTGAAAIALVLSQIEGGPAVLELLRQTRDEIAAANARGLCRGECSCAYVFSGSHVARPERRCSSSSPHGRRSRSPRPERSASSSTTWNIFGRQEA